MDEQERKEHFQGFAELLMQELNKNDLLDLSNARIQDTIEQRKTRLIKQIIAERAYDLVLHAVWNIAPVDLERLFMKEVAAKVPDITAWPNYE